MGGARHVMSGLTKVGPNMVSQLLPYFLKKIFISFLLLFFQIIFYIFCYFLYDLGVTCAIQAEFGVCHLGLTNPEFCLVFDQIKYIFSQKNT